MTYRVPGPKSLAAAVVAAGTLLAGPAMAVPVLDIGANAGAAIHWVGTPALDLNAEVDLRGLVVAGQYWNQLTGPTTPYWQAGARYNVSPVPMIHVSPGVGLASSGGAIGPMGSLHARFAPVLLPVSFDASAGAALVSGSTLFPYHAGIKFSPLPFTALALRYRGWGGGQGLPHAGLAGPEIGIEIGI